MAKGMRLFRCPKCGEETEALAIEVSHRCRNNQRKMTQYELIRNSDG